MLMKTMKYKNLDGKPVERKLYFHMSEVELLELELREDGNSFGAMMNRMVEAENVGGLIREFKKLLLMSYGEKSLDGETFIKDEAATKTFEQSAAYSALFMELALSVEAGTEFINALIPPELIEKVNRAAAEQQASETPEHRAEIFQAKGLTPPPPPPFDVVS